MPWRKLVDWRVRLLMEKALGAAPYGSEIHKRMQRTSSPSHIKDILNNMIPSKIVHWEYLLRETGYKPNGGKAVEIGTGWVGIDLVIMWLLGYASIITLDKNPHLRIDNCRAALEGLTGAAEELEKRLSIDGVEEKLKRIRTGSLDDYLSDLKAAYYVGVNLADLNIADGEVELFYSYSTFQNIPMESLEETLREGRRILKPLGFAYHDVRFIDNNYKGPLSADSFRYLEYPEWLWKPIQSHKFNYQNRVRHAEFMDMMRAAGFVFVAEKSVKIETGSLSGLELQGRFKNLPLEDLAYVNASMAYAPMADDVAAPQAGK